MEVLQYWQGFKLTDYERFNYIKGLKRQLDRNPEDEDLILRVRKYLAIIGYDFDQLS